MKKGKNQPKHANEMTLGEFRALPEMKVAFNDPVHCDSVVILPTGQKHDSGYGCMEFVPIKAHVPLGRVGAAADDLNIWPAEACRYALRIDCMRKSRLLNLWSGECGIIIGTRCSTTEIRVVGRVKP